MFAQTHMLAFPNIGMPEMVVIGIVALLIFGRRLPEVGRSLGRSFVEFKKGLKDTGDDLKQINTEAKRTLEGDDAAPAPRPFNEPQKTGVDANGVR